MNLPSYFDASIASEMTALIGQNDAVTISKTCFHQTALVLSIASLYGAPAYPDFCGLLPAKTGSLFLFLPTNNGATDRKGLTTMVDLTYFSAARQKLLLIFATCLLAISSSGCRTCGQPCAPQQYTPYNTAPQQYQQFQQPAAGFGGGSGSVNPVPAYGYGYNNTNATYNPSSQARIQAPSTYSLNIPGANSNANSYRVGQLPSGLLNTQQTAPTPANRPANYNQQQGWRRSDGNDLNTSSTNTTGTNQVASNSGASSVLVSSNGSNTSPLRTASATNAVGTGVSFTESTDYRTTSTDERRDNSRLPVTDATNVRVTSSIAQGQNSSGQFTQPYYQPRYASLPPTTYQGAFVRPDYSPLPQVQTNRGSFGQQFAAPAAQPQQQVLAQSTARYDPYQATASTASSDWRDRGRESNSF